VEQAVGALSGAGGSLGAFRCELTLCATIVVMLLSKVFFPRWRNSAFVCTLAGLGVAMVLAFPLNWIDYPWSWLPSSLVGVAPSAGPEPAGTIFSGALAADSFTTFVRVLLLLFTILFTTFLQMAGAFDQDDLTEFHTLMLGALLGMCLMIAANHVLIVLLGVEMASVPCYVLAGIQRHRSRSSEGALKYAVFGAGTAGVMLFGLSLLAGTLGSADLPTMSVRLAGLIGTPQLGNNGALVLALGGLMLMVGVAFKLSAVPFHFWAPDVFEGATAEVAAFLSVASKLAALGLLVRLAANFAFPLDHSFGVLSAMISPHQYVEAAAPIRQYIVLLLSVLAAVTCTFGNLAAYGQTNMKRLLAYSTIAHAGYMMMPVAAAVALVGAPPESSGSHLNPAQEAIAALVVYMAIYLFMNLAAFAIVAFLRNATGSEEIADYAGLVRRSPGLTVCMALVMFSLVGLPPLAGFQAKLLIFLALVRAGMWPLLLVGILNTVLSLFYYLRVVRVMALSPEPLYRDAPEIPLSSLAGSYCAMLTLPVVVLFFLVGGLSMWANLAAFAFFPS
jgi:NADH-quinone oxidoreductase subunit N